MVKVEVPSTIAAGIRRRGIPEARNTRCAIGARTKNATKRLTPPYVTNAPARTTASMARFCPSRFVMNFGNDGYRTAILHQFAEERTEQEKRKELRQKACRTSHEGLRPVRQQRLPAEQCGDKRGGRRQEEDAPAPEGEPDEEAESDQDAEEPHASDLFQQDVQIERRGTAEVGGVGG